MNSLTRPCPPRHLPAEAHDDLLALADDEFVMGHRHSEWLGLSPFLEEDLTMASIAQDELGHARALYQLIWPDSTETDARVVRRVAGDWRSCSLVERQSRSWEFALIRHALYDISERFRWELIVAAHGTLLPSLPSLAAQVQAEERFHERHAIDLVVRLGRANTDARDRLQLALTDLWPDALLMTDATAGAQRWAASYVAAVGHLCELASLTLPTGVPKEAEAALGQQRLRRHPDFQGVTESLLAVFAFDPEATW